MKVKELDKEEYFLYGSMMHNAETSYVQNFWIITILLTAFAISYRFVEPTIYSGIMIGLLVGGLILNYFTIIIKVLHIKKLFDIQSTFSLLN